MRNDYQTLITREESNIATITMNRPESLNSLNITMLDELGDAVEAAASDATVRCIVLTGAGRAFGSGQDVNVFVSGNNAAQPFTVSDGLARYHRIIWAMRGAPKPVIAMVQGVAAGASCNLALACDLRIAAETARFIEAFARIALVPDAGGPYFLSRLVGIGKALELALLADEVSGRDAEHIGLVNRCVPLEELEATTMALAQRLAAGPTGTYALIKSLMYRSAESDLATSLNLESEFQSIALQSEDHHEGVQAFLQKRSAHFTGK